MSRKNKTLRAFLHQNQNPTIEQAWDAAWKQAQKKFHARSMQDMEKQVADLQAESEQLRRDVAALVEAAQRVLDGLNARIDSAAMHGGTTPVFDGIANLHDALAAHRKQGGGE